MQNPAGPTSRTSTPDFRSKPHVQNYYSDTGHRYGSTSYPSHSSPPSRSGSESSGSYTKSFILATYKFCYGTSLLFSRDILILMLLQSLKDSLAEAATDKVPLSRNQPDHILTSIMPEETSPMPESTPDLYLPPQDQITSTIDNIMHKHDSITGEPISVPHKSPQERPSLGDWMGTWWARGRSRERSIRNDDKDSLTDKSLTNRHP
jgi:hypothetical protein